jgi:uncharacterized protein (TIGR02246 family)
MSSRTAFRVVLPTALLILVGAGGLGVGSARAQVTTKPATKTKPQQPQTPATKTKPQQPQTADPGARGDDRAAIHAVSESFVKAFDSGDAKALAALLTEDAESVNEDGTLVQGRSAIAEQFARVFASDPGIKIKLQVDSIRFLSPDVAKEEGRCTITHGNGEPPDADRYTVLYVKQGGRWLQSYVREHPEPGISPHDRLKELEWMVGQWVDESPESLIVTTCQWSEDKNFLLRFYDIKVAGKLAMSGTQRIGWDPVSGQIKSWVFDSQGGSSEGLWSRDGNRWVVKMSGPLQDGKVYSETNVFTFVNKDQARWKSVDRTIGGQVVPDLGEFVIVRKPPPAQPK